MKAVFLDADTLGDDIDLGPIAAVVDELRVYATTAPAELDRHLGNADLILTNKVVIDETAMRGRRGILVLATGTNNIDVAAAQRLGVPVLNVTNYGTESVAQHTLMLLLALAARLPRYQHDLRSGQWQTSPFFCLMQHSTLQLTGKNLVVVGAGSLGREVARLAQALGMQIHFSARPGCAGDSRPSLEQLLPIADALTFHCPLTEATRGLLDNRRLQLIRPGCLVINCARGGIIDEVACLRALREERIGGLGVDVLPEEPPAAGHALLEALDDSLNLVVTPHNAWISREARQNIIDLTAANIRSLSG